jgi:hypothetical protein
MTSLREKLIQYIKLHGQMHFRDIEKYAEENGYKAYTAVRRLQEVRDPKDLAHFDPDISTVEEDGTIKFYVCRPGQHQAETPQDYKRPVRKKTPPINDPVRSQTPPAQNHQSQPRGRNY